MALGSRGGSLTHSHDWYIKQAGNDKIRTSRKQLNSLSHCPYFLIVLFLLLSGMGQVPEFVNITQRYSIVQPNNHKTPNVIQLKTSSHAVVSLCNAGREDNLVLLFLILPSSLCH